MDDKSGTKSKVGRPVHAAERREKRRPRRRCPFDATTAARTTPARDVAILDCEGVGHVAKRERAPGLVGACRHLAGLQVDGSRRDLRAVAAGEEEAPGARLDAAGEPGSCLVAQRSVPLLGQTIDARRTGQTPGGLVIDLLPPLPRPADASATGAEVARGYLLTRRLQRGGLGTGHEERSESGRGGRFSHM